VPANTTATVRLPAAHVADVVESGKAVEVGSGISAVSQDGDETVVELGAGRYVFRYAPTSALQ
jgi:alpha-L-rhamnosidase